MRRAGFTLMEVLVSIALIAALLGVMFTFLGNLLSSRDRVLEATARRLAAGTLVERLETELMTCLAGDPVQGAGVQGDAVSLTVMSRGVSIHRAARGIDDAGLLADLQWTEYRFDESTGVLEARRREPGDDDGGASDYAPIGAVHRVRFRYHDGTGWRDEYDSLREGALPTAVEIAVWYRPWPGGQELVGAPGPDDEEPDSLRLTFDSEGGFDEAEYARRSEYELEGEPRPDRVRVIRVPDGVAEDPYAEPQEAVP